MQKVLRGEGEVMGEKKSRWLTVEEKEMEVSDWVRSRAVPDPSMPTEPGGMGYPDPEVFALTDRLNSISGICTVQSCAGHRIQSATGEYVHFGQLWIRPSELMGNKFYAHGFDWRQANNELIERAAIYFQPYGNEVIDIQFKGLEVSAEHLARSSQVICELFERLAQ